jgi:hypothetical protein
MPTYTTLRGITHIGDSALLEQIEHNIISFFDWGCLQIGGFYNYTIPSSGHYGGDFTNLRLVKDRNYNDGQVWESARSNWIWESGVQYNYQPIAISGIYVNNTFYPTSESGVYSYHINYPEGRIVFDTAISTSSSVKLEYSNKQISWLPSNTPYFRELLYESFRVDDSSYNTAASGMWSVLSQNRIQLPAVIVEAIPRRTFTPMNIGSLHQSVTNDVLFHIFAEESFSRNQLVDIITLQADKTIYLYDLARMEAEQAFPLNYLGDKTNNPKTYPQLVAASGDGGFRYRKGRFTDNFIPQSQDSSVGLSSCN